MFNTAVEKTTKVANSFRIKFDFILDKIGQCVFTLVEVFKAANWLIEVN